MGNQIQNCCQNCMKIDVDQLTRQTRFVQVNNNFKRTLKCKKFYISSQSLDKQKINQLVIFTDSSLTMTIPNFNLKLKNQELQKLQETIKYQIYNNNLLIKENCFVLNPIEQEQSSQYGQFKEFQSNASSQHIQNLNESKNIIGKKSSKKQKLKNQIQQFMLRNKSRAFRFKNPLRNYQIGQIIVAIVPIFEKIQDLKALKEAIEQGLSMCQDSKSVGISQISFMLGYQPIIFQKITLEYILGFSRSRKEYVFKKMNQFIYLTRSHQQMNNFFKYLNIYTNNHLDKINGLENFDTEKIKKYCKKLGNKHKLRQDENKENGQIRENRDNKEKYDRENKDRKDRKYNKDNKQNKDRENRNNKEKQNKENRDGKDNKQNKDNKDNKENKIEINKNQQPQTIKINGQNYKGNQSFSNTSFHSYEGSLLFGGTEKSRVNSQSRFDLSRRSFANEAINNPSDTSELGSKISDRTQLNNIRLRSFKSKQSNVSDYF